MTRSAVAQRLVAMVRRQVLPSLDQDDDGLAVLRFDGPDADRVFVVFFDSPSSMSSAMEGARRMWETDASTPEGPGAKSAVGYNNTAEQYAQYLEGRGRSLPEGERRYAEALIAVGALSRDSAGSYHGAPDVVILALDRRTAQRRPALWDETLEHEVLGHGFHVTSERRRREVDRIWAGIGDAARADITELLCLVGYTRTSRLELVKGEFVAYLRDSASLLQEVESIASLTRRDRALAIVSRLDERCLTREGRTFFTAIEASLRAGEAGLDLGMLRAAPVAQWASSDAPRPETAYVVPGRGESLREGLARTLAENGFTVRGREVFDLASLPFGEQVGLVRSDLIRSHWDERALLAARSFGAYLLLHALIDIGPFPGRVVLFSPVLGAGRSPDGRHGSIPPLSRKLLEAAANGRFPAPRALAIHTGSSDAGCDPRLAERFAAGVPGTRLHIVNGAGHDLGDDYLRDVLARLQPKTA